MKKAAPAWLVEKKSVRVEVYSLEVITLTLLSLFEVLIIVLLSSKGTIEQKRFQSAITSGSAVGQEFSLPHETAILAIHET